MSPICLPCCPLLAPNLVSEQLGGQVAGLAEDDVVDLKGVAVLGDPVVGVEVVTLDERGPGALRVRPLPSPQEPTPAERET